MQSYCSQDNVSLTYCLRNGWLCYLHVSWLNYRVLGQLLIQLAELQQHVI